MKGRHGRKEVQKRSPDAESVQCDGSLEPLGCRGQSRHSVDGVLLSTSSLRDAVGDSTYVLMSCVIMSVSKSLVLTAVVGIANRKVRFAN